MTVRSQVKHGTYYSRYIEAEVINYFSCVPGPSGLDLPRSYGSEGLFSYPRCLAHSRSPVNISGKSDYLQDQTNTGCIHKFREKWINFGWSTKIMKSNSGFSNGKSEGFMETGMKKLCWFPTFSTFSFFVIQFPTNFLK